MVVGTNQSRREDRSGLEFLLAMEGDRAAFAAFLARFERRIARVVGALVPRSEAEDVFQEVCLRLLTKGHLYDSARPLTPWLDAVTRQVCGSARRRLARRDRERRLAEDIPAPPADDRWVRDAVHDYLRGLPSRERQALRLVLLTGLTQREAARRLGIPSGTVASWLAKGVRALRARLGERT